MGVVARIDRLAAMGQFIERRHCEIEMAFIDQPRHLPVEERDQERGDMGAVDVGVGHDDDARIAQIFFTVVRERAAADRLSQVGELRVRYQLVLAGRGDIEDFSAKRKDRLGLAVARNLGGAAGGIALDDEEF